MKPAGFYFLFVLFSFLFSGCATTPPVTDADAAWQARQAALAPVSVWQIRGRLAVRAGDQGWHATLNWERDGDRHRMDFTGPLGRGHLRLVQDGHGAELRDADQRVWRAADAALLLHRATGWTVPLDGLNYWVLGLPAPGAEPQRQLDGQGRLARLTQSGWDVRFLDYARHGAFDLPGRLYITRQPGHAETVSGGDSVEVRLSIDQWSGLGGQGPGVR